MGRLMRLSGTLTSGNLARGAAFGVLGEALALPAGIITAALLTRSLGLAHYGFLGVVFAAIAPWAWIAASIIGGRSAIVIVSSAAAPLQAASAIIRMSFYIGFCGWALFTLFAPLLAQALHRPEAAGLLILAGAEIMLLPLARAHRDALTANGHYVGAGWAAGVQNLTRLILIVALSAAGASVAGVIGAVILSRIAEIIWCRFILSAPLAGRSEISVRALARLTSATFLYAFCLQIFNRVDILILTALGGANAALSQFAAAQSVATAPGLISIALGPLLVADIRRSEPKAAIEAARRCDQISAITASLCIAAAGAAPSISRILFSEHFRGSGELLTWLLLGAAGGVLQSFATAQMVAQERFRLPLLFGFLLLIIAIPAHFSVIPYWQASGAAIVTGLSGIGCGIAATIMLPAPRRARLLNLVLALSCGGAGFAIAHALGKAGFLLLDGAVGMTIAFALLRMVGIVSTADLKALWQSLFSAEKGKD